MMACGGKKKKRLAKVLQLKGKEDASDGNKFL